MKLLLALLGVVGIIAALGVLFLNACEDDWCFVFEWQKIRAADSFERCASLGFPVMESYPAQCRAGDKHFTQTINPTNNQPTDSQPIETNMIRVAAPLPNSVVESPLLLRGEARGNWYFEASFPAEIRDANGKRLGMIPVMTSADWMTTNFVPFEVSFSFDAPTTDTGTLILHKDNPSGLPEHDDSVSVPIRFNRSGEGQAIKLYYYNPDKDKDASGNILCSDKGLVAVTRTIPRTTTPIQDTIRLLIKGELNPSERAQGITTEYPLSGLSLTGASLANGTLRLDFEDPHNRTSGGSCRVSVLFAQIEATAKQFPGVHNLIINPPGEHMLFQP